jgi:hypothetical protein
MTLLSMPDIEIMLCFAWHLCAVFSREEQRRALSRLDPLGGEAKLSGKPWPLLIPCPVRMIVAPYVEGREIRGR